MEIGTNELTRPFRIPRKKTNKSDDEKVNSKPGLNESVQRSPLAAAVTPRKAEASFSNRIVPPTKRKASQDLRGVKVKKPAVQAPSGGEVFDKIIGNMVNPPKEKKPETPKERDDVAGPSNATTSKGTPSNVRRLTKEELERQPFDNSACYAFLRKEGLMERLLGHKMLTGRVDSYVTLGYLPLDPGEQAFGRKSNYLSGTFDDFPAICEPAPIPMAVEERRGPRTPPGSPGHQDNSSIVSSRGAGSATHSSHPPPPPPLPPDEEKKNKNGSIKMEAQSSKDRNETADPLSVMNELDKCSHNQLAEFLVGELQNAMKQVDHKILLSTLKDALMKVGKKNEQQDSGKPLTPVKKEEPDSVGNPPVEMDIESDRSAIGDEPVLPPPPPAPRTPPLMTSSSIAATMGTPMTHVPPPPCILPTPPPPPPLVLQAAPPPPVILRPPPPQNVIVPPAMPPPIILQPAPPAPVISQPPSLQQPSISVTTVRLTASKPMPSINASVTSSIPSTFIRPPPVQRSVEKPLQSVSGINNDIQTTSFSTTNMPLSFTAPPPPMLVNTAVPPPNFKQSQPMQSLNSGCATEKTTLGAKTLGPPPGLPNPLIPSTSNSVLTTMNFPPPKVSSTSTAVPLSSTKTDEMSMRPPLNPSQIDFSKPPPAPILTPSNTGSSQMTSSNTAMLRPTASFSRGNVPVRLPAANSKPNSNTIIRAPNVSAATQLPNLTYGKTVNLSGPMPTHSSASNQIPSSSSQQNVFIQSGTSGTQLSSSSNVVTSSVSQPQSSLGQSGVASSTPTSENVIKTLLNALAIPQKSQQVSVQSNQAQSVRPTIDTSQPPPNMSGQSAGLDRFGNSLKGPNTISEETRPTVTINLTSTQSAKLSSSSISGSTGGPPSATQNVSAMKDKNTGVTFSRPQTSADQGKQSTSAVKKNEQIKEVTFFPPVKETIPMEKPVSFFGSHTQPSKHNPDRPPIPPPAIPAPSMRPKLDATAGTPDKPLPPIPHGFIPPPQMRPRFPPVPMPFRMRGPFPFPLRRPPPPFAPLPPGFRVPRPRFNR